MRVPLSLAAAALLAGCSTLSDVRDAWGWDPTAPQQRSRVALAPEQVAAMTNQLAELQIQRNEIRSRISAEPDIWGRQRLYEQLHTVGRRLSPLERELTAAAAR
jgi:hypothetical protein